MLNYQLDKTFAALADPARRAMLYKRFQRTVEGPAEGLPSTAMGLYIVATLAERIKAEVRFEPQAPSGASFVVRLANR